jgi:hypothetical protein
VVAVVMATWTGGAAVSASRSDAVRQTRSVERAAPAAAVDDTRQRALHAYANLPVAFVENRGQTDPRVRYYATGSRYGFYFTRDEIVLSLMAGAPQPGTTGGETSRGVALALRFLGGNPGARIEGRERTPGAVNVVRGNAPARWQTALASYGEIVYRGRWPGVDMMLREQAGALKYEFHLQPGPGSPTSAWNTADRMA